MYNGFRKPLHGLRHLGTSHLLIFHHIKALALQPQKLLFSGIIKFHALGLYQRKGVKIYISLCRNLIIQLTDGTAAQISRIFIFGCLILDLFIDSLKVRITNDSLTSQNHLLFTWNGKGHIFKYSCIVGNDLAHFAISTGNSFGKLAIFIGQNYRQPIQLPRQENLMITRKSGQFSHILSLVKRQHRRCMTFFGKFIHRFISYCHGRASRQYRTGLLLKRH